jgi:hypothetical protein
MKILDLQMSTIREHITYTAHYGGCDQKAFIETDRAYLGNGDK